MAVDKELLEILCCPQCKGDIRLTDDGEGLVCEKCRIKYPVREDIPVMLVDEAEELG